MTRLNVLAALRPPLLSSALLSYPIRQLSSRPRYSNPAFFSTRQILQKYLFYTSATLQLSPRLLASFRRDLISTVNFNSLSKTSSSVANFVRPLICLRTLLLLLFFFCLSCFSTDRSKNNTSNITVKLDDRKRHRAVVTRARASERRYLGWFLRSFSFFFFYGYLV